MSDIKTFNLTGTNLSLEELAFIAHAKTGHVKLTIESSSLDKMKKSRQVILDIVKKGRPVYGINTG